MMARYPGADGGLERHRADGGRHHRARRSRRRCRTACRRRTTALLGGARRVLRRASEDASAASWCRASRAAAGAAGPTRTASPATVSVCQGDVRNGSDRRHRAEVPGAGRGPRAAHRLRRRRQVPRRARHRHAGAQPRRGPLEFRADAAHRTARPGACGAASRASSAATCCACRARTSSSRWRGAHRPVPVGAEAIVRTGGGGGWGDPLERDPEAVRRDVIEEYISADQRAPTTASS